MDEITKTLGILMEQGRWMTKELEGLRTDVKDLQSFKWKILGFSSCAAFLATLLVELFKK